MSERDHARVPGRTRRRFYDKCKAAAVQLVPDEISVGAVARDLDSTTSEPSLGDSFPELGTRAS